MGRRSAAAYGLSFTLNALSVFGIMLLMNYATRVGLDKALSLLKQEQVPLSASHKVSSKVSNTADVKETMPSNLSVKTPLNGTNPIQTHQEAYDIQQSTLYTSSYKTLQTYVDELQAATVDNANNFK